MTEVSRNLPCLIGASDSMMSRHAPVSVSSESDNSIPAAAEPLPPASRAYCEAIEDRVGIIGS